MAEIMTEAFDRDKWRAAGLSATRFVFALCLTAPALWCGRSLFLKVQSEIKICFDLQYENYRRNHWQIFYTPGQGQKQKSLRWRPVTAAKVQVRVSIPESSLSSIRLDFGTAPGAVVCRNFRIRGREKITLKDMQLQLSNQLKDLKLQPDGLTCSSSGNDPFIIFRIARPLAGRRSFEFDGWAFSIILVPVLVISLALSRLLTAGKRKRDWLYWADGALVILFAATLSVPGSHIGNEKVSAVEKRRLAPFRPLISADQKIDYRFGRNFDTWFNDHFFGRDMLLQLDFFLFDLFKSPVQVRGNVFYGFDHWHFLSRENALRNYHNLDLFTPERLARAAEDLNKIDSICRRKGKKLYLVVVPDKHRVYGEFFPGAPKIRPDSQSRLRQLEKYLSKNTSVPVIYLLDPLLKNKSKGLLYWKTDTHWNHMGAFIGCLEILNVLRKDFPDIPVNIPEIRYVKTRRRGDLGGTIRHVREVEYPMPQSIKKFKVVGDPIEKFPGACQMLNPGGKYNVLVIRDSFASLLLPYMGNSFRSTTALWSDYLLTPNRIGAFDTADIVIFECVERLLPFMLNGIQASRHVIEQKVR